jgi:phosphatidylinositol-3-phosphatase
MLDKRMAVMATAAFLVVACSAGQPVGPQTQASPGSAPAVEPSITEPVASSQPPAVSIEPTPEPAPAASQNVASQRPAASSSATQRTSSTPQPNTPTSPPATPVVAAGQPHVFLIVMEDMSTTRALKGSYINYLAKNYAYASNYHGVARPSLPNHLALAAGDTFGITSNAYRTLPSVGLGVQLTAAGISWRAYIDGMTNGCMDSPYPYALRHNPFAFLGGKCPANVVPIAQLDGNLRSNTPNLVWITPDDCHSGHDCPVETADAWLSQIVPKVLASAAWRDGGVLFLLWDEGENEDVLNHMPLIVIEPKVKKPESAIRYDHYSTLATITDVFGMARIGRAASAQPLTDLVSRLGRP